jgi:ribosome biogenesis protein UTP30
MGNKKGILKKKVEQTVQKKEKSEYEYKSLSPELVEKALLAAEAQIYKLNKDSKIDEPIMIQISTLVPTSLSKEKEHTRRMIRIPNKLRSIKNTSILLVTKDPVDIYRIPLIEKNSPTTNTFTEIIGYKKFKSMVGTSKKAVKTYHEYDIIITDNRLHSLLPKLLEPTIFCKSAQKFPLMLQMAKQDPDATLVKSKKSSKMKDERVDPVYVHAQIKSWCRNTTFVPSTGPSISIIVGYPNMTGAAVVENIDAVITFLSDKNFRPIGGIIHDGMNGILDLYLRANDKTVPIMKKIGK